MIAINDRSPITKMLIGMSLAFLLLVPAIVINEQLNMMLNHNTAQEDIPVNIYAYSWEFDNLMQLSTQVNEHNQDLLYIRIGSYAVQELGFEGLVEHPLFTDNVSSITGTAMAGSNVDLVYYENEHWVEFPSYPTYPLYVFTEPRIIANQMNATQFQGLTISMVNFLTSETKMQEVNLGKFQDERDNVYNQVGESVLLITYLFNDGFHVQLTVSSDLVLIDYQYLHAVHLSPNGNGIGTDFGSCSTCKQNEFTYMVKTAQLNLGAYVSSINEFLVDNQVIV